MNSKTKKALEESIAKWERNATVENPDDYTLGVSSCPLCILFWHKQCTFCPVKEYTGRTKCNDTPYEFAEDTWCKWDIAYNDETADEVEKENLKLAAQEAAKTEADFLKSLREE